MPINRDPSIPPPMIGKIGPYTVFVTPPSTPNPTEPPLFQSPQKAVAPPAHAPAPPPVQPPPQQFDKSFVASDSDGSILGFFRNAAFKVQNGICCSSLPFIFPFFRKKRKENFGVTQNACIFFSFS